MGLLRITLLGCWRSRGGRASTVQRWVARAGRREKTRPCAASGAQTGFIPSAPRCILHLGAFSFFLGAKCWNLATLSFAPRILFLFLGATKKILGAFSFFCFRVQSQHRVLRGRTQDPGQSRVASLAGCAVEVCGLCVPFSLRGPGPWPVSDNKLGH